MKSHSVCSLTIALIAACFANTAHTDDWPVYRHDNRRSGVSFESLYAEHLAPIWSHREPYAPQPAWSGQAKWDAYAGIVGLQSMRNYDPVYHVISVDDTVYLASSADGTVRALDAANGATRWVHVADGPVRIAPTYHNGLLYFGSDDGHAYCITADAGELVWRWAPAPDAKRIPNNGKLVSPYPVRTGVLIQDGRAYFGASLLPWSESYLCAVDATTGSQDGADLFVRKLNKVTLEGALLASPTKLYVPQGRSEPLVFDRRDGGALGALSGGGGVFALLTPDHQFAHGPGNKTGWITVSDAESNDKIASFDGGIEMIVLGNHAFVLKDTALVCFNRESREVLWAAPCDNAVSMIMDMATVYVGANGIVTGYDASDGKVRWSHEVSGRAYGLAIARGRFYASTDQGVIHAFQAGDAARDD